jgi:hypothetical protein
MTRITGPLHEDQYEVLIKSSSVLRIMKSVANKCRENQNTQFMFTNSPPPPNENSAVYEIMWKTIVEPIRPQMTIRRMPIACWIPKATDTHSEHVILIAFPLHLLQLSDRPCTRLVTVF